jgi:SAM-dependent methyltransferase
MKTMQAPYVGFRILEAMHSAAHYADTIFCDIRAAMPSGATRILDFGAGDAAFVDKFRAIGIAVDCVEPDAQLQALLRSKTPRVFSDIAEIDTGAYDFVYTVNVLEHIDAVEQTCAQLHRILRPGGRLFVFVPAFEVLWTSLDDEVGHVRRFSKRGLRGTLTGVGFSLEQLRFFDSLGFPAVLGVRLLERLNLFRYEGASVGFYDRYLFPISRGLDRALRGVIGKNLVAVAIRLSERDGASL